MSDYIRLRAPHIDLGEDDYHQWVTLGRRVKADSRGRLNPRMWDVNWTQWICNNVDCPAEALVHDGLIVSALEAL